MAADEVSLRQEEFVLEKLADVFGNFPPEVLANQLQQATQLINETDFRLEEIFSVVEGNRFPDFLDNPASTGICSAESAPTYERVKNLMRFFNICLENFSLVPHLLTHSKSTRGDEQRDAMANQQSFFAIHHFASERVKDAALLRPNIWIWDAQNQLELFITSSPSPTLPSAKPLKDRVHISIFEWSKDRNLAHTITFTSDIKDEGIEMGEAKYVMRSGVHIQEWNDDNLRFFYGEIEFPDQQQFAQQTPEE